MFINDYNLPPRMDVRYEYPSANRQHPFDQKSDLEYYIYASGYTYLGRKSEFDNPSTNPILCQKIPLGYKTLTLLRRYCMLDKTGIIWQNSQIKNEVTHQNQKFVINSYYGVPLERLKIYTGSFENEFDSIDSAIEFAKDYLSKNENRFLISEVIYTEYWH